MNLLKWLFGENPIWTKRNNKPFRSATPGHEGAHDGSHNHGKGTSKARRLMAKRSRRINRRQR